MQVFTSAACLGHHPGAGHPESAARLAAVLAALHAAQIAVTDVPLAPVDAEVVRVLSMRHTAPHIAKLRALDAVGGSFDADTHVGPGSWAAAVGACTAVMAACSHAVSGRGNAFAAIRPPGHHALADRGMGFCLINQIAILASLARLAGTGRQRVLIVDWDVHHGNGTQALVDQEADTRFVSMHQWPWYPGSGAPDDRGVGNCFNIPLPAGLARQVYVEALWGGITAATAAWTPDIILISAGYDGMRGDPLGGFTLEPDDFATWVTRLRAAFPDAPIVALMEGGYAPERLAAGVVATVRAMA